MDEKSLNALAYKNKVQEQVRSSPASSTLLDLSSGLRKTQSEETEDERKKKLFKSLATSRNLMKCKALP